MIREQAGRRTASDDCEFASARVQIKMVSVSPHIPNAARRHVCRLSWRKWDRNHRQKKRKKKKTLWSDRLVQLRWEPVCV